MSKRPDCYELMDVQISVIICCLRFRPTDICRKAQLIPVTRLANPNKQANIQRRTFSKIDVHYGVYLNRLTQLLFIIWRINFDKLVLYIMNDLFILSEDNK